ncbi:MAG: hypothetical protein KF729_31800 [Sandaracinaceae bacterium]|nr:hypothetical protein [Sandaracinaceae bacterium]
MPLVAIAIDPCSPPMKPLEQVLRDRREHVFLLCDDDPFEALDERRPDIIVITSRESAPLADAIRGRLGDAAPRIVAVYPECDDAPAAQFDDRLAAPLSARTLAEIIDRGRITGPSGPAPGSSGGAPS